MKLIKKLANNYLSLTWYYKLLTLLITICSGVLIYFALKWLLGILVIISTILLLSTNGEFFTEIWNHYKQSKNPKNYPSFLYHILTEKDFNLPISTVQYLQGVEIADSSNEEIYYIHLKHAIDNTLLEYFESSVRQIVQQQSNHMNDCVVSNVQREPFEAIKIRVCNSNELAYIRAQENVEDF